MADYAITAAEVKAGVQSSASEAEVAALITWASKADACLDGAGIDTDTGKLLKLYAIRHILTMTANAGQGQVTSQNSASGAARSFKAFDGAGLSGTPFGSMLQEMDVSGCVSGLFAGNPGMFLRSVGPRR